MLLENTIVCDAYMLPENTRSLAHIAEMFGQLGSDCELNAQDVPGRKPCLICQSLILISFNANTELFYEFYTCFNGVNDLFAQFVAVLCFYAGFWATWMISCNAANFISLLWFVFCFLFNVLGWHRFIDGIRFICAVLYYVNKPSNFSSVFSFLNKWLLLILASGSYSTLLVFKSITVFTFTFSPSVYVCAWCGWVELQLIQYCYPTVQTPLIESAWARPCDPLLTLPDDVRSYTSRPVGASYSVHSNPCLLLDPHRTI